MVKKKVVKKTVRKKVVRKNDKPLVKKVVRSRVKTWSSGKLIFVGIMLTLPAIFFSDSVKGTSWYDIFAVMALFGVIMAVYNFINMLIIRKRRIVLK